MKLIGMQEFATRLRVSREALVRRVVLGEVPEPATLGNRLCWPLSEIEAWEQAKQNTVTPAQPGETAVAPALTGKN